MKGLHSLKYNFGEFEFDAERSALYYKGDLVKAERKTLKVLAVLIREPHRLVPAQEIIETVWHDSRHGVTPTHLAQSISKLRKALAKYDPDTIFIETVKGVGYSFVSDVERTNPAIIDDVDFEEPAAIQAPRPEKLKSDLRVMALVGGAVVLSLLLIAAKFLYPGSEEEGIKHVIQESQRFESLVLYRDPESFEEAQLDNYWTSETDPSSSYDRQHIRTGVRKLIEDGRRYGPETKNEQFEFQSIEINADGDTAIVKTLEKWFIAEYRSDGSLIKNKTVGPYFVSYIVRKINDRWLIEKSSTARANPPAPVLISMVPTGEITAGKQFDVNISGHGFQPNHVYLKVVGPGCPQETPCTVPNSALRIRSQLTETRLFSVPLTLAPGVFAIQAQNGDSIPSNELQLVVP